jgi:undecaprenyl-diphosphatase
MQNLVDLNDTLFFYLHSLAGTSDFVDWLVIFVAEKLDWFVIIAGVVFMLVHRHKHIKRKGSTFRVWFTESVYIMISVSFGWILSYIGKHVLARPRPYIRFEDVEPLFVYGGFDSFPSGHATLFAALAVALYIHHKKIGILFMVFAVLISLARVIAGIHFPIDIIAGWALGAICAYFVSTRIHA